MRHFKGWLKHQEGSEVGLGGRPMTRERALWLIEKELERYYKANPDCKRLPTALREALPTWYTLADGEWPISDYEVSQASSRVRRRQRRRSKL